MTRLLQTALRLRRRPLRFIGMLLVAAIALAVVATIPLQAVPAGKAKTTSGGPPSVVPLPAVVSLPATVKTFIDSHCIDCHDGESAKGDLDLTVLKLDATDASSLQRWTRVVDRVQAGEMPPKRKSPADETKAFLGSLGKTLYDADVARQHSQGRTLGRRLTRTELENTLADLLGVRLPLKQELPEDPYSYIFDTVAAGQDVSPQLLERYQSAADMVLETAFERATVGQKPWAIHLKPRDFARNRAGVNERHPILRDEGDAAVSWSTTMAFHGRIPATRVPASGWYRITINAYGINPPPGGIVWSAVQNGVGASSEPTLHWIGSIGAGPKPQDFVFEAWMERGHLLEVRPNDGTVKKGSYGNVVDRGRAEQEGLAGIAMRSISLERIDGGAPPEQVRQILFGDLPVSAKGRDVGPVSKAPAADLARLMKAFASKAFRRPVEEADLAPYVGVARAALSDGATFGDALRAGYRAILSSPRFLYLIEEPGPLNQHALACRLSYLFWSTAPDPILRSAADEGRLADPTQLHAQVERMLNHKRSQAFVTNFTDQWLNLREIEATQPDEKLYPEFDPVLQQSMLEESRAFFAELLKRNLGVANLVDSDFAMLDNRLAVHYRLPEGTVGTGGVRPVPLKPEWRRGGLLGQAAIHKVTANGTTTSPILRGVWVLERLLGQHVLPPPPNTPAVEPDIRGATTIREQLEKHRSIESCATCHTKIDPPGFALESYDVIGGWRDQYRVIGKNGRKSNDGPTVDASYKTADGQPFKDVTAFKQLLLRDREEIARCMAEKLLVYGTGATISYADRKVVDQIIEQTKAKDYGLRSIVHAVVQSTTFRSK